MLFARSFVPAENALDLEDEPELPALGVPALTLDERIGVTSRLFADRGDDGGGMSCLSLSVMLVNVKWKSYFTYELADLV